MTVDEDLNNQETSAPREQLRALRPAKEHASMLDVDEPVNQNDKKELEDVSNGHEHDAPNMKFRNYLPRDKRLQDGKLAPVELPKFEDPVGPASQPSEKIEDPFMNIAPKKPNWDLRRDVQKRLDKLERRTQKALYELMLEQEKEKTAREIENAGNAD